MSASVLRGAEGSALSRRTKCLILERDEDPRQFSLGSGRKAATIVATVKSLPIIRLQAGQSVLRPHQPIRMLGAHDMIMEIGDPLAPGGRQVEVIHGPFEVLRHAVPVEAGIFLDEVGR